MLSDLAFFLESRFHKHSSHIFIQGVDAGPPLAKRRSDSEPTACQGGQRGGHPASGKPHDWSNGPSAYGRKSIEQDDRLRSDICDLSLRSVRLNGPDRRPAPHRRLTVSFQRSPRSEAMRRELKATRDIFGWDPNKRHSCAIHAARRSITRCEDGEAVAEQGLGKPPARIRIRDVTIQQVLEIHTDENSHSPLPI